MAKALLGFVIFSVFSGIICARNENLIKAGENFHVLSKKNTFIGAWLACKTEGLELASVGSATEQTALESAISDALNTSDDGYWLGAVVETQGSSSWYWIDTHLKFSYDNWGTNQPNFSGSDYRKQCLRLGNFYKVDEPTKWQNVDCDLELLGICKNVS